LTKYKFIGFAWVYIAWILVLSPMPSNAQRGAVEGFNRNTERESSRRTPSALRGLVPNIFDPNIMDQDVIDLRLITPPLERPINPDDYVVGPGDNLFVSFSNVTPGFALTITPEGLLVIPSVGEIDVKGLSLSALKIKVEEKARPQYRTGEISTTLLYPRQFRITIAGSVNIPGGMVATPVDRVSDVLFMANRTTGIHQSLADANPDYVLPILRASDRNIEIRRLDDTVIKVDLRRYMATGRLEDNPLLLDGDIVYVPVRNVEGGTVAISGAINIPGLYEYAEGDMLGTILDLTGGLTVSADVTRIEISRSAISFDGLLRTETIAVDLTQRASALSTPIRPRDRIFVRTAPKTQMDFMVVVRGSVRFPGTYPIQSDGIMLSRIIDLAGGFTEEAYLSGGAVVRPIDPNRPPPDPNQIRIARLRMSRIGPQEVADFEAQAIFNQQFVVADFAQLFEARDESADVRLHHGDVIFVPSRNETVTVMGQVASPGQLPYISDRGLDYYISQTGGYGKHARRSHVQVIKAETQEWLSPKETDIQLGDTIWVPRKPVRDYYAIFKETLSVTATLTTLYLVLQQITK
jgi:polysaccharide export outer membrane protein